MAKQMIVPNLTRKVSPGWCLGYVSAVLGIDSTRYPSAWEAWLGTAFKHPTTEALPGVPVLLWFEHWGTYGPRGGERFGNWGHVIYYVPGVGFYTSPGGAIGSSEGFEVWQTIGQIEARFYSKYVGWSEDLAGTRFADTGSDAREEIDMLTFIASSASGTWYATDGITKRPLAPGENQLLVDLGQARFSDKPGKVNLISPVALARIPNEASALPLDTAGIVAEVLEGIRATGVTVEVDVDAVADAVLDRAADRMKV